VDRNIFRVNNPQALGVVIPVIPHVRGHFALAKVRVVKKAAERGGGTEGFGRSRVRLVVGRLGLDMTHIYALGPADKVVIKDAVLGAAAVEPRRATGLDKHAAGAKDGDLRRAGVGLINGSLVIIVVGHPRPHVLKVPVRLGSYAEEERRGDTFGVIAKLRTLGKVEIGANGPADAEVRVPHGRRPLRRGCYVPLHQDGTGRSTPYREWHLGDLHFANIAFIANLDHNLGVLHVAKVEAGAEDL
jgi:hypothetical protein